MKILYLSNQRLPTEKAYGIQIVKTCEAFVYCGWNVCLLFPNRGNKSGKTIPNYYGIKNVFEAVGLPSLDFYWPGKWDRWAVNIKNLISAFALVLYSILNKYDIYFSRDELPLFILSYFKKNLIFEAHKFSLHRSIFYKRFRNTNIKIVTISKGLADEFIEFGFHVDKILIAQDGVDLEMFNSVNDMMTSRANLSLPMDRKIVLYSGHLYSWKGVDILAESARYMPSALFVFVGGTEIDITSFRNKYLRIPNILILGRKPYREIPNYLCAADILVLPNSAKNDTSRKHTSPLKLFEYMASGRPIVASRLPSILEILNDNNSVLVSPDDFYSLTDGINRILGDKLLSEKISEQALEDVKKYTWIARASKILAKS